MRLRLISPETTTKSSLMTTAEIFIINILDDAILENAKKIIFSSPRQMLELPDRFRPSFRVDILRFNKESKMQICKDICGKNKMIEFLTTCKTIQIFYHFLIYVSIVY